MKQKRKEEGLKNYFWHETKRKKEQHKHSLKIQTQKQEEIGIPWKPKMEVVQNTKKEGSRHCDCQYGAKIRSALLIIPGEIMATCYIIRISRWNWGWNTPPKVLIMWVAMRLDDIAERVLQKNPDDIILQRGCAEKVWSCRAGECVTSMQICIILCHRFNMHIWVSESVNIMRL